MNQKRIRKSNFAKSFKQGNYLALAIYSLRNKKNQRLPTMEKLYIFRCKGKKLIGHVSL